jgi:membrane protease YdiL (CAAX protease family)
MNPRVRALLGAAAYALLALGVFPFAGRRLAAALHGTDGTLVYLVDHMLQLAAILVFGAVAARIEKRPFSAYGLPWREALRTRFWSGAVVGVVSITVLVVALDAMGAIELQPPAAPVPVTAGFGLAYAIVFVLLAVREEFLYRGYGQVKLAEATQFWIGAAVTTTWFVATHATGRGESTIGLASVAVFGVVACLTLRRTGDLWFAIGLHAAWDWGETYLFGVSDSGHSPAPGHFFTARVPASVPGWLTGGTVGPEGSVLCVAVVIVLGLACARWLRPAGQVRSGPRTTGMA